MAKVLPSPQDQWTAVLGGSCLDSVAQSYATALVAEGLRPDDASSLAVLTPALLDTLGLEDLGARNCILGLLTDKMVLPPDLLVKTHDPVLMLSNFEDFKGRAWPKIGHYPVAQEIIPGVFLGSIAAARDTESQKKLGITHILNATSHGSKAPGCKVLSLPLQDNDGDQDIKQHFDASIAFMNEALAGGSAVLVHCIRGVSRSSTLVAAYIMRSAGLSRQEALGLVKRARPVVNPKVGFLHQLKQFEQELTDE